MHRDTLEKPRPESPHTKQRITSHSAPLHSSKPLLYRKKLANPPSSPPSHPHTHTTHNAPPNDNSSGTSPLRPGPQTSSARTAGCPRPAAYGRTVRAPASAGSWRTRRRTSGSRRRCSWRWLGGWRRSATCARRRRRARGCRPRRTCRGRG